MAKRARTYKGIRFITDCNRVNRIAYIGRFKIIEGDYQIAAELVDSNNMPVPGTCRTYFSTLDNAIDFAVKN